MVQQFSDQDMCQPQEEAPGDVLLAGTMDDGPVGEEVGDAYRVNRKEERDANTDDYVAGLNPHLGIVTVHDVGDGRRSRCSCYYFDWQDEIHQNAAVAKMNEWKLALEVSEEEYVETLEQVALALVRWL